jgi:hypothetical protein
MIANSWRLWVLAGVLCLLGGWVGVLPTAAQRFFLPLEAGDGVLLADGSPKPYVASVRTHALFGRTFRFGPSVAVAFANPDVSLQAGARVQVPVHVFRIEGVFNVAEIDLAAEALWGTEDRNPIGGALVLAVNRVVQFTVRGGYDLGQEAAYIGTSVGTDLTFLFGGQPTAALPPPVPRPPVEGCPGRIFTEARIRAQAAFSGNDVLRDGTGQLLNDTRLVSRFRAGTLADAGTLLTNEGLAPLAQHIDDTLDAIRATPDCVGQNLDTRATLDALLAAWDRAVVLTGGR